MRSPCPTTKEKHVHQWRPSTAKNEQMDKSIGKRIEWEETIEQGDPVDSRHQGSEHASELTDPPIPVHLSPQIFQGLAAEASQELLNWVQPTKRIMRNNRTLLFKPLCLGCTEAGRALKMPPITPAADYPLSLSGWGMRQPFPVRRALLGSLSTVRPTQPPDAARPQP